MASKRTFEALADEKPPPIGREIATSIAPIMETIAAGTARQESLIATLTQAMRKAEPPQEKTHPRMVVTQWDFEIRRDARTGLLVGVSAYAVRVEDLNNATTEPAATGMLAASN